MVMLVVEGLGGGATGGNGHPGGGDKVMVAEVADHIGKFRHRISFISNKNPAGDYTSSNHGDGYVLQYGIGSNTDITISLSDLQGEFGGSNPISISEYYRALLFQIHHSIVVYPHQGLLVCPVLWGNTYQSSR